MNFKIFIILFLALISNTIYSQKTIQPGSVVINMGIVPQTIANGLKPYGLVYNLLDVQKVPVLWCINSTKVKDGPDFTVDGISFRGGTFVIEAGFANFPNVQTAINSFVALGVVKYVTLTPVTVPVYKELAEFPNWVLDTDNGNIAQAYLVNASLPATSYRQALPTALNSCDDLFILPHADPTWVNHGLPLLNWNAPIANGGNAGWIWSACHAVSVLENLGNTFPGATLRTNFLSNNGLWKYANNAGAGFDNTVTGAINPLHNNTQVFPFNNPPLYPTDPIMQYMGLSDNAHNAGSERIYVPTNGWRSTTKVAVFDPGHISFPLAIFPDQVAIIAYGYAFGNTSRGKVMYEAGHDHDNGTVAENVAAQRAFLNFSFDAPAGKAPIITTNIANPTTLDSGSTFAFNTTVAAAGNAAVTYLWTSGCGGTFSNTSIASPIYTAPTLSPGGADVRCLITLTVTDPCGRKSFKSFSVLILAPPAPPVATNDVYGTYNSNTVLISPLLNDTDLDNDINPASLTNTSPLSVAGGTFVPNNNGTYSFIPNPGFVGTATLNYQICDFTPPGSPYNGPLCSNAVITVNVAASPCASNQTVSSVVDYGFAVTSSATWLTPLNALGAPNATGSSSTAATGSIVIDLGAGNSPLIGSQIQFRIYSTNATNVTGTIDASTTTTFPQAPVAVSTLAALATPSVVVFNVSQANTRYVRITGINRFGLESITYNKLVCINSNADVKIVKTASTLSPNFGSSITFTLTASNLGPDTATNVNVTDLLPSGYTFTSATPSIGTYNPVTGLWNVGGLLNGGSATLDIVALVNATGNFSNSATISSNQNDPNTTNNSSTSTPIPVARANVGVLKTSNNATPNVGSSITFTIVATNFGPDSATNVTVTDLLPTGYTYLSSTVTKGSYAVATGLWTIGNLPNGTSETLTITATVNATGNYANTASITATETDSTPGNNISTNTPAPIDVTDLQVVKTVSNLTPYVGDTITFTIVASNFGPSNATGVIVSDVLSDHYTYVSSLASLGTYNNLTGIWTIGNINNGASQTLTITVIVNPL